MKYQVSIWFFLPIAFLFLNSCKKKSEKTVNPTSAELLNSNNLKKWQIDKIYLNDTLISLTTEQLNYTRTYKADSTFYDSDGMSGRYILNSAGNVLKETILSGGSGTLTYTIETLNKSQLVLRLISDGNSSLNNQFHFYAK
jgi:hypothetical protein